MFEYVNPQKGFNKEELKGKVIAVVVTLASAAGLFTVLYWAASGV
jgi:hypothetical protein